MCGRYSLHRDHPEIQQAFDFKSGPEDIDWSALEPRYNIAPTDQVLTVVANGERRGAMMRWGLIPFWGRDTKGERSLVDVRGKTVNTPINARAETIETATSFSSAFENRRCLIPADGFYEWRGPKTARRPMYIYPKSREPFAMAGIWGAWRSADGVAIRSCAIVTTAANSFMAEIHDRMPVMLTKGAENIWLEESNDMTELKELLVPYPSHEMAAHEVSPLVNSVKNDSPQCIEPGSGLLL
jgi:putative SOS response-associated peptidase YedK